MRRLLVSAFFSLALVGCAESETVKVKGTVTLDGKPVDRAEVMFLPAGGRMATGVTNSEGKFELSTNAAGDGAVPGEHKVTIVEHYEAGKPPPMTPGPLKTRFPPQYSDPLQTPFSATVQRDGKNDFQFDMNSAE